MLKSFSGLWPSVSNIAPLATCDCYTVNSISDHTGNNSLVLSNLHYGIVCFYATDSISGHKLIDLNRINQLNKSTD